VSVKETSVQRLVRGPKQPSYGHSIASARYESVRPLRMDEYDRTRLLLQWVGTHKRVLEVGCSTGYMSKLMVERNCIVTGIEIDPKAAECARRHCREVHIRDLNALDWMVGLSPRTFDVVLFGDVLEHLIDPAGILLAVRQLLNSDGSLVVSLPNVVHWMTRFKLLCGRFDYESCGTLDHTHLRFFTVRTSRELLWRTGYSISRFHPAIGGRMSGHLRPAWQCLANLMPGLFAFQLLFQAKPV